MKSLRKTQARRITGSSTSSKPPTHRKPKQLRRKTTRTIPCQTRPKRSHSSTNQGQSAKSSLPATNLPLAGVSTHPEVLRRRAELKQLEATSPETIKPVSIGTNGKDYPPFVFVLGGPGSGKGTHSERLMLAAENKSHKGLQDKIYHINVGGVLRKAQFFYRDHKDSPTLSADMAKAGPVLEEMMATGAILPSWVTVTLIRDELDTIMTEIEAVKKSNPKYTANVIIDGFPRSIENLESFENLIAIPSRLLVMDVPTDVMVERIIDRASGREDDNIATIKKRINVFQSDTAAVLTKYSLSDSVEKALEYNKKYGAVRIGIKIFGDRPSEETSKDFIDAYTKLSTTPIY